MSSAFIRLLTLSAQVILGILLAEDDFGVYAITISLGAIAHIFRDAGARLYLLQIDETRFAKERGACFWLSVASSLIAGGVMVAASFAISAALDEPRIIMLSLIIAASLPLQPAIMVNMTRLQRDLQFRKMAQIDSISAAIRTVSMVVFAVLGMGAASLALPAVLVATYEAADTYRRALQNPWRDPIDVRTWGAILRTTRWVLLGSVSDTLTKESDYLVLGWFVPAGIVGLYYFGYQIVNAGVQLVGTAVHRTLLSSLNVVQDAARQVRVVRRSVGVVSLFAAPALFVLVPTMRDIEHLIWGGKWAASVPVVQVLAVLFALNVVAIVPISLLHARGEFRRWSLASLWRGLLAPAAPAIAGFYVGSHPGRVVWIAVAVGAYRAITSWTYIRMCERRLGLPKGMVMRASLPVLGLALIAASVAGVTAALVSQPAASLLLSVAVFGATYCLTVRFGMPTLLAEAIGAASSIVPATARLNRLLRLKQNGDDRGSS